MPTSHPRTKPTTHAGVRGMRQPLARSAVFALLAFQPAFAAAKEPVELYPCAALLRSGKMDESGTVTRSRAPREYAAIMTDFCDYVVLGRFVSITDRQYDKLYGLVDDPVASTFQVSEVLHGAAVTAATIRLDRALLVAPDQEVSRKVSGTQSMMDGMYRRELAEETERELEAIRESGKPLTLGQQERLVDALWRLVEVPPRTRYELHELIITSGWSTYPLNFHSELGAIRPGEVYLLGLSDEQTGWAHFHAHHTYLFWGQEAQDIAAACRGSPALREKRE